LSRRNVKDRPTAGPGLAAAGRWGRGGIVSHDWAGMARLADGVVGSRRHWGGQRCHPGPNVWAPLGRGVRASGVDRCVDRRAAALHDVAGTSTTFARHCRRGAGGRRLSRPDRCFRVRPGPGPRTVLGEGGRGLQPGPGQVVAAGAHRPGVRSRGGPVPANRSPLTPGRGRSTLLT
jgi:hypothetical protein